MLLVGNRQSLVLLSDFFGTSRQLSFLGWCPQESKTKVRSI